MVLRMPRSKIPGKKSMATAMHSTERSYKCRQTEIQGTINLVCFGDYVHFAVCGLQ